FLNKYLERKIVDRSPFETIDKPGVGWLVRLAAWTGREAKPDLKLGICGEHGGDPDSIEFFDMAGLDYVSCSPYRVPIARVAAAQAQDAGLHRAGGRPLPHAAHAHARGVRDSAHRGPRAAPQRGPRGGDRARARPRPPAVRAHRRERARPVPARALRGALPPQP